MRKLGQNLFWPLWPLPLNTLIYPSYHIKIPSYRYRDPIIKIRRFDDRLIFMIEIPITGNPVFMLKRDLCCRCTCVWWRRATDCGLRTLPPLRTTSEFTALRIRWGTCWPSAWCPMWRVAMAIWWPGRKARMTATTSSISPSTWQSHVGLSEISHKISGFSKLIWCHNLLISAE